MERDWGQLIVMWSVCVYVCCLIRFEAQLELGSAGHGEYRWPQHKHAHPPGEWPPPGGLHGSHGGPYNRGKVILCQRERERYHNQLTNEPFIEELV